MTCFHGIRFYDSSESIGRVVAAFLGAGLARGGGAVISAAAEQRDSICAHLRGACFCVPELERSRRLVIVDAAATLNAIAVNGTPDPARFSSVVSALIGQVSESSTCALVYDEMVDILWRAQREADALRLETLWDGVVAAGACALLCGHGPDPASSARHRHALFAEHTHVVADNGVPHPVGRF